MKPGSPPTLWARLLNDPNQVALLDLAMRHVADCLADALNRPLRVDQFRVGAGLVDELVLATADPDAEVAAVCLYTGDELPGHALLLIALDDAPYLVDWLTAARPGTTSRLGQLEYSALAELGNLALSAWLNAVAEYAGVMLRLSPPVVTVNQASDILQSACFTLNSTAQRIFTLRVNFWDEENTLPIQFWILPDPDSLEV